LDPVEGDIEDVVEYAYRWTVDDGEAFSKSKDRPERLGKTIISRLPPSLIK